ncbi:glycosyltransferase [Microbacterium flavescens]|uniref:glycosyltransferase n=1 Tax=Microbacterium flavescens TaxID=69366 RepID=UPI001BDED25C|nr:glycosyltransferase [Microbacterium flavescens]BFF10090.1 glycosyltransferase [Microbacterium flavescens]
MRLLLATAGSRGDVEPFAALARRAATRGHEVRLVAPDNSGADLTGVDTVSMGVDYSRMIEDQGVSIAAALRSYRNVVRPVMHAVIVESARAALEYRPDVLVTHPKILSAPLVAHALSIPHVMVEIVPAMTPTRAFPAAGTTTRDLGFLNRLTYRAAAASSAMFRADLKEVSALTGVKIRDAGPPVATLMPISPAILHRPADWPSSVHLTGPWRSPPADAALSPDVAEFIRGGGYVYAGFGSMATGDPIARAREVVRGIREHGARALLVTGLGGLELPADLRGDDTLAVRSVDHDAVLPLADAAVHHGGIGTVHAATRAGAASVVVPFIADQPFWGEQLHASGLAPAPIPQRKLSASRLAAALAAVANHRAAVASAAEAMAGEDGTGAALAILEGVR